MVYGTDRPTTDLAGVPSSQALTDHPSTSTVFIDTPGAVYEGVRFRSRVVVRAPDVTIRRCFLPGAAAVPTSDAGLIDCTHASALRCVIEDNTFDPQTPSYWLSGILGHDYLSQRNIFRNLVDGHQVYNTNAGSSDYESGATIRGCIAREPSMWNVPTSRHSDGVSHNDVLAQVQGGANAMIYGNDVDGTPSTTVGDQDAVTPDAGRRGLSAVLVSSLHPANGITVRDNWTAATKFGFTADGSASLKTTTGTVTGNRMKGHVVAINLSERQRAGFTVSGNVDATTGASIAATYQLAA